MKKLIIILTLTSLVSACASLQKWKNEKEAARRGVQPVETASAKPQEPSHLDFQKRYRDKFNAGRTKTVGEQGINYHVRAMMQSLVSNLQYVNSRTPMAVSSFVFLDGSYEYADIVGKQLAESFVHEVHKYGIPVVDFKSTDYIRVTQNGDFVLSKDFLDLDGDLPIQYVLTGTLVKQPSGYLVNARVIGMKSKAVVATAQGKLPTHVINSLISSENDSGLMLMSQGE